MKLYDSHTHILNNELENQRKHIMSEMGGILECSAEYKDIFEVSRLSLENNIYGAVGVHPLYVNDVSLEELKRSLENIIDSNSKIRAVGEIGLDYRNKCCDRERQKAYFRAQTEIAEQKGLPVILHSVRAVSDTLEVIREKKITFLYHGYNESIETTKLLLNRDVFFGIGTAVLRDNALKLRKALEIIPLNRIMLETDSPFMIKGNTPFNIALVADKVSEIYGISADEILKINKDNFMRFIQCTV